MDGWMDKRGSRTYGSDDLDLELDAGCSARLISNTHRSIGVRVSFEMMATTSCVTPPVKSHSETAHQQPSELGIMMHILLTCARILFPKSVSGRTYKGQPETNALFEIVFEAEILRHEHSLSILFHHVEIIRRIHSALEENTKCTAKKA